jgi:myo-inositol-1(or 4)-monophosphatase
MNLEQIAEQAISIIKDTGAFARNERKTFSQGVVETKGLHNFVSYVDTTCEKRLVEGLLRIVPQAGFIAEEGTGKPGEGLNWVIDPLDGTTNYIHGLSPYAVSVALMEHEEVLMGIVYEIGLDECFWAYQGGKAYMNGTTIRVSENRTVNDSLIATGFPYYDYTRLESFFRTMDYFMRNSHGLRRLGSAATDLAYVACGRFEAFYEYGLNPWDVAAGSLIVQYAGGKVSDFNGGANYIRGREIVATNKEVFKEFKDIIQKIMEK